MKKIGFFDFLRRLTGWVSIPAEPEEPVDPPDIPETFYATFTGTVYNATVQQGVVFNTSGETASSR